MTGQLLRQDPMLRSVGKPLLVLLPFVQLYVGVVAYLRLRGDSLDPARISWGYITSAAICILAVVIFQQLPGARRRVSDFALGLPLSPRGIWWVHLAALMLVGSAVVALTSGQIVLFNAFFQSRLDRILIPLSPSGPELILHSLAAMFVSVVIVQAQSPSLVRIPWGRRALLRAIAAFVVGLILLLAYSLVSPLAVVLSVGAALVIAIRFDRRLPTAWSVAPKQAGDGDAFGSSRSADATPSWRARTGGGRRNPWSELIYAYSALSPKAWALPFALPVIAIWGVFASGAASDGIFEDDTRFVYIAITSYILLAFGPGMLNRAYLLDYLPFSRARLLAILNLPIMAIFLLGYFGGAWYVAREQDAAERIQLEDIDGRHYVRIPVGECEIAWDGVTPVNEAPWGERHEAWSTPAWGEDSALIYSTFSTPVGSSLDFVAYQLHGAVEQVYGAELGWEQIRDRYLVLEEDGDVVPRGGSLTLAADHPEWEPRSRGTVAPAQLSVIFVFWLTLVWVYVSALRATVSDRARKFLQFGLLGFAMAVHLGGFAWSIWGTELWVTAGFFKILLRHLAAALPGGVAAQWVLAIGLVALAYWLVLRRLYRAEFPRCKAKGC